MQSKAAGAAVTAFHIFDSHERTQKATRKEKRSGSLSGLVAQKIALLALARLETSE
jgi:hypothetical protein